jgi:predicted GNAT family acetyltransferase
MTLPEFIAYHRTALERDEVRHGLILNALNQAAGANPASANPASANPLALSWWTMGAPGSCAIRMEQHSIVLGALDQARCRMLAETTAADNYPGVIGPDTTAEWFADQARTLGHCFLEPEPQWIYAIREAPRFPGSPGHARLAGMEDAALLARWMTAFHREAIPLDPPPPADYAARAVRENRFLFWIDAGQPVAMAAVVRRLTTSAAITGVYTPPELRGRGYAGSVTAAAVERIRAEGRSVACLYADQRNPASNRCYTKIGFTPVCASWHFHKAPGV